MKIPKNNFRFRSFLFVPAIKKNFFEKILTLHDLNKPDVIIFDLEDSVQSDFKSEARILLIDFIKKHSGELRKKYTICLRINKFDSSQFDDDIKIINIISPDLLMLPKVESEKEIIFIRKKFKKLDLVVLIETIDGMYNLEGITSKMIARDILAVGPEDFSAQLLMERPNYYEPSPLWYFYSECVLRARKNNLILLDGPSRKYTEKNLDEFEKECKFSVKFGFDCKMAIHPNQIFLINKMFDKTNKLKSAEKILKYFNELRDGLNVISNNEEMLDAPSYKMYKKILNFWNNETKSQ